MSPHLFSKQSPSTFNLCHPFYFPSKYSSPFNLCLPIYFPSNPFPLLIYVIPLISCTIPLPFYFIALTYIYIYIYKSVKEKTMGPTLENECKLKIFKVSTVYPRVRPFWIYTTVSFFKIFSHLPVCVC